MLPTLSKVTFYLFRPTSARNMCYLGCQVFFRIFSLCLKSRQQQAVVVSVTKGSFRPGALLKSDIVLFQSEVDFSELLHQEWRHQRVLYDKGDKIIKTVALFTQRLRISPERWFANSPPMVIDTKRSISTVPLCNSHRKPALWLLKRRDGTHHVDDISVSQAFPPLI